MRPPFITYLRFLPGLFGGLGIKLFEGCRPSTDQTITIITNMLNEQCAENIQKRSKQITPFCPPQHMAVIYFDGAASGGHCAAGGIIHLNPDHYFTLKLNCGRGSNMKAEILRLWCVMMVASCFGLSNVAIFGDSRVTINWDWGEHKMDNLPLSHWCSRIRVLINYFEHITLQHIYRQFNHRADILSKEAYGGDVGVIYWKEVFESNTLDSGFISIFYL